MIAAKPSHSDVYSDVKTVNAIILSNVYEMGEMLTRNAESSRSLEWRILGYVVRRGYGDARG